MPRPTEFALYVSVTMTAICAATATAASAGVLPNASGFSLWVGTALLSLVTLFVAVVADVSGTDDYYEDA